MSAVKVIPMYSEEMLCVPSTAKPRLNALQELFVYYAARQDISVTGKTSQPSFEDILKVPPLHMFALPGGVRCLIIQQKCDAYFRQTKV